MIETISGKYTIKQIFKDNWSWFLEKHQTDIRPVVIENVEKILACGDKDKMGYSLYQCPCCGKEKFVAHTCKSRFCNSCGKVMTNDWIRKAQAEFLNIPYYHLVFTRPNFGGFFASNRKCLDFLFQSAVGSVMKCCGKEGFLPGICSVLYTFGSKLDFHPHIHILLTLGGLARDDNFDFDIWKDCSFFPEKILKTVNPADIQ